MRIAMVCNEKVYENLAKHTKDFGEISPPLKKWNETVNWIENGANLIVLDTSMPFADTITSLPIPTVVYKGSMKDFRVNLERVVTDVRENLSKEKQKQAQRKPEAEPRNIDSDKSNPNGDDDFFVIEDVDGQQKDTHKISPIEHDVRPIETRKKRETTKKDVMDFFGGANKVKGVKGWLPKELRRFPNRGNESKTNHWSHIPNRLVIYAPKGSRQSISLSWEIAQSAGMNGALAEITHPYSELAAFLQSIPPVTLMPPEERVKQNPVWEMEGIPIISSPVVYPVQQPWNVEVVKSWLKMIEDHMRGRMIVLHLGSQMPIPILKEVMAWSSANIWMLQDTEIDLGMADIQIETLTRQDMILDRSVLLIEVMEGNKLPWKDILGIPLLGKMTTDRLSMMETINRIGEWLTRAAKSGPSLVRKEV